MGLLERPEKFLAGKKVGLKPTVALCLLVGVKNKYDIQ